MVPLTLGCHKKHNCLIIIFLSICGVNSDCTYCTIFVWNFLHLPGVTDDWGFRLQCEDVESALPKLLWVPEQYKHVTFLLKLIFTPCFWYLNWLLCIWCRAWAVRFYLELSPWKVRDYCKKYFWGKRGIEIIEHSQGFTVQKWFHKDNWSKLFLFENSSRVFKILEIRWFDLSAVSLTCNFKEQELFKKCVLKAYTLLWIGSTVVCGMQHVSAEIIALTCSECFSHRVWAKGPLKWAAFFLF